MGADENRSGFGLSPARTLSGELQKGKESNMDTQKRKQTEQESWAERLTELYDEAKARHNGMSLTIYGEVSQMLDYLEGIEDVPEGFDLFQECDNLASRLHRA